MADTIMIKDVMTKKVISCSPEKSVSDAAKLMKLNSIGVVIVLDKKKNLVGLISERDIINKVVAKGIDFSKMCVEEVMTKKVICGYPEMSDVDVAMVFAKKKIKKLPIVKNGKVVGIITQTDLLKLLSFKWAL